MHSLASATVKSQRFTVIAKFIAQFILLNPHIEAFIANRCMCIAQVERIVACCMHPRYATCNTMLRNQSPSCAAAYLRWRC